MTTENVDYLNYLVRTYDGVTKLITQTKQRIATLPGQVVDDPDNEDILKGDRHTEGLETVKGRIAREIEKELVGGWDIWRLWMKMVPGIGPAIAGGLVMKYYFKFVPVCQKCGGDLEKNDGGMKCLSCGKDAKKDGVLQYRKQRREFATISKWWAFMGRHTVEGAMPKRKKGTVANWSTPGRTLGYQIGEQINRQGPESPYKRFLLERKAKHQKNHPDWSKGHVHNAAKNEAIKLFLSHFWVVAHEIEGLPVTEPYAGAIMGHTHIVEPFFWAKEKAA
jgi:hypothetical protein